jgi:hypothetical protein
MSTVKNADHLEVLSPVIRLRSGEIINPMGYQKFHREEMLNLTRIYRFGAKIDWTVADHLRLGSLLCESDEQRRFWLPHEAFESLSGLDIQKPLKQTWPWYVEAENKYLEFVYGYLGLDFSRYDEFVSELDHQCFLIEEDHFFKGEKRLEIELVKQYVWLPLDYHFKQSFPEIYGDEE